jgi:hypothetical protein
MRPLTLTGSGLADSTPPGEYAVGITRIPVRSTAMTKGTCVAPTDPGTNIRNIYIWVIAA